MDEFSEENQENINGIEFQDTRAGPLPDVEFQEQPGPGKPPGPQPATGGAIPSDLPKTLSKFAGKAIECPAFEFDDNEAATIAKHLTIILGDVNSKLLSAIIIIIIVFGKLTTCMDAIKKRLSRGKADEI